MDDTLVAELQASLSCGDVHSTYTPHPHYTLYKQHKDGYANQEVRRRKILEHQKTRRRDFMDYARRVVEGEECECDDLMEEGGGVDEVDTKMEEVKKPENKKKMKKKFYPFRNQLMLSEWLVEVPKDFTEKWLMYVCPVGKRCLVISAKGTTTAYGRNGVRVNNFPSLLPGGCSKTTQLSRDNCILDCIYYEGTQTFYVLDVMCWGGHPVYNSDTEFRTFWKATKIRDNSEKISKYSRINPLVFVDLPSHPCTRESIAQVLSEKWPAQVDGLLFIHKEAHYWPTRSPLAAWLKPHMVPDILGIPVSQEFLSCTPVLTDVTMKNAEGSEGKAPKGSKRRKAKVQPQSMEVSTADTDEASIVEQSEN